MAITKVTSGLISADAASVDLNIDAGTLYVDSTNNRVGIANTSPSDALDVTGNIVVSGTVDGRDLATDGSKLDGIESGATADQTQSEINALGITATGLSGTPNITVGTIDSGNITISGTYPKITLTDTDNNPDFTIIGGSGQFGIYDETNTTYRLQINSSGNAYFSGKVGIGAASPDIALHVDIEDSTVYSSSFTGSSTYAPGQTPNALELRNTYTTQAGNHVGLWFETTGAGNTGAERTGRIVFVNNSSVNYGGDFAFQLRGSGAAMAERMRITAAGNVGIGTDDPTAPLDLRGNTGGGGTARIIDSSTESSIAYKINGATSGTVGWVAGNASDDFFFYSYTLGSQAMTLKPTGRVGIGETDPAYRLDVNSGTTDEVARFQTTANARIKITSSNTANAIIDFGDTDSSTIGQIDYDNADNSMRFATNGSESMRIDSSGNVVMTTAPAQATQQRVLLLDVNCTGNQGSGYLEIHSGTNSTAKTRIEQVSSGGSGLYGTYIDTNIINVGNSASAHGNINFITNQAIRMTVGAGPNAGRIGIGTTSPSNTLTVKAPSGSNGGIEVYHNNNNKVAELLHHGSGDEGRLSLYDGGTKTVELHGETNQPSFINSGSLGIGTTSPDTVLDVESTGANGIVLNQDKGNSNVSGRLFFKDANGTNAILNISGGLAFFTGGTVGSDTGGEKMRLLSGGGITFNGDTAAANALDDYEEGEWTPTCPNVTLTGSGGHYTKVGNRVWVTFYLQFPTTSNTNAIQVNNLPFTVKNHDSGQARANGNRGGWTVAYSNSGQELRFLASSGTTTITAHKFDGTTVNNNNVSAKSIYGGGFYEVA